MSPRIKALFTAAAVSVATAACSTTPVRTASPSRTLSHCAGGTIQTVEQTAAFAACDVVTGNLTIAGSELIDLSPLASLSEVTGVLAIRNNSKLETLEGLEHLGAVGALEIVGNPELETLKGLEGLTRVERLEVSRNGIYKTTGLEGLKKVDELVITHNGFLISLAGLSGVAHVGSVRIERNPRLCAMYGLLPNLAVIERDLSVSRNAGLSTSDLASLKARTTTVTRVAAK